MRVIKSKTWDGIESINPYSDRLMEMCARLAIAPQGSVPAIKYEAVEISEEEAAKHNLIDAKAFAKKQSDEIAALKAKLASFEANEKASKIPVEAPNEETKRTTKK